MTFLERNEQRKLSGLSHAVRDGLWWLFMYPRTASCEKSGKFKKSRPRFATIRQAFIECAPDDPVCCQYRQVMQRYAE